MKKAIQKTWRGNPQPTGDWRVCSNRFECDGVEWVILYKFNEKGFLNLKVAANGRALNKANYWFSFKIEEKYFFGRDATIMRENREDLYQFMRDEVDGIVARIEFLGV